LYRYATDNQATKNGFGYLKKSAITVTGWITKDDTHGGGRINRKMEKTGDYPYRIFYDAFDPLGNLAITVIREIYVTDPCRSDYIYQRMCPDLSELGKEPVCATCTEGKLLEPCVCVAKQDEVIKIKLVEYVAPQDFAPPVILITPGSVANGFAVAGVRAVDASGNKFTYDVGWFPQEVARS
jgi:hypothetical protein